MEKAGSLVAERKEQIVRIILAADDEYITCLQVSARNETVSYTDFNRGYFHWLQMYYHDIKA
jgi:hypothetical protein